MEKYDSINICIVYTPVHNQFQIRMDDQDEKSRESSRQHQLQPLKLHHYQTERVRANETSLMLPPAPPVESPTATITPPTVRTIEVVKSRTNLILGLGEYVKRLMCSVLTLYFCNFCCLGFISIYYSIRSIQSYQLARIDLADYYAHKARLYNCVQITLGTLLFVLGLLIAFAYFFLS